MPTSRVPAWRQSINLCSGAWAELGVSAWGRTHQNWAIDPEPLIIFTAGIADKDPRFRDEAMDWCIHYWRHVSQIRLRNILAHQDGEDFFEHWGVFAATVNARAGIKWPEATTARTAYKTTGRSMLRPFTEPSLVFLRMRAIFGFGARTEILRYLLFNPGQRLSAANLADVTNYAKRNVAESCDSLVRAGVVNKRTIRHRSYYSLTDEEPLAEFVGSAPEIVPDWSALFRVVSTIVRLADAERTLAHEALVVEVHQALEEIEDDLDVLEIEGPLRVRGAAFLDVWKKWASGVMTALASGVWPEHASGSKVTPLPARRVRKQTARRAQ
jgi:hypothetical protein